MVLRPVRIHDVSSQLAKLHAVAGTLLPAAFLRSFKVVSE